MRKKTLITAILTGTMVMSVGAASAWAVTPTIPLCNVEGCTQTCQHLHDDVTYLGHYYGDGHEHAQYCLNTTGHHGGGHHRGGHHGGRHC